MKKLGKKGEAIIGVYVAVALIGFGHFMHTNYQWGKDNPNHTSRVEDPTLRSANNRIQIGLNKLIKE